MMNDSNHYFFRLGSLNYIFTENYHYDAENNKLYDRYNGLRNSDIKDVKFKDPGGKNQSVEVHFSQKRKIDLSIADRVFLAIYYENSFTAANYFKYAQDEQNKELQKIKSKYKSAVKTFFDAKLNSIFWIFLDEHILSFKLIDEIAYDVENMPSKLRERAKIFARFDYNGTKPKIRSFVFLNAYKRTHVPEIFSTTDASNIRGTILKLDHMKEVGNDKLENAKIAQALVTKNPIVISNRFELLRYLSPIQLETFFFKYFDSNEYVVSSCRGGSKFKIDLFVHPKSNLQNKFFNQTNDGIEIQIKRSFLLQNVRDFLKSHNTAYLICLNDIDFEDGRLIDGKKLRSIIADRTFDRAFEWVYQVLAFSNKYNTDNVFKFNL